MDALTVYINQGHPSSPAVSSIVVHSRSTADLRHNSTPSEISKEHEIDPAECCCIFFTIMDCVIKIIEQGNCLILQQKLVIPRTVLATGVENTLKFFGMILNARKTYSSDSFF